MIKIDVYGFVHIFLNFYYFIVIFVNFNLFYCCIIYLLEFGCLFCYWVLILLVENRCYLWYIYFGCW